MNIQINAEYRLTSDINSWAIQKQKFRTNKKTGIREIHFESVRWYSTLEGAVNGLGQLMVRTSEAETMVETLADVERVCTELTQALTPQFVLIPKKYFEQASERRVGRENA